MKQEWRVNVQNQPDVGTLQMWCYTGLDDVDERTQMQMEAMDIFSMVVGTLSWAP